MIPRITCGLHQFSNHQFASVGAGMLNLILPVAIRRVFEDISHFTIIVVGIESADHLKVPPQGII
jgi:hypothetical protein